MMTIAYRVGDGLYVNLTNKCPCACRFCLRSKADGAYGSDSLWLEREPTVEEACAAIDAKLAAAHFNELVFCGYGEPTERLEALLAVAKHVREQWPKMPMRVNTNGLSDLINATPTAYRFAGLFDCVSISLNAATAEEYLELCRPKFGIESYAAMLRFTGEVKNHVGKVILSIVGTPDLTPEKEAVCRQIADNVGVTLRIREFVA